MSKAAAHITNNFLRTRMVAIRKAIFLLRQNGKTQMDNYLRLFSSGVIPTGYDRKKFEGFIRELDLSDDAPLQMDEIASFNSWFLLHPEKVAGREKQTTSLHFPVTVVGDKHSIIDTIKKGMKQETGFDFDLSLKRHRAKAKLLLSKGLGGLKIIKQGLTLKTLKL